MIIACSTIDRVIALTAYKIIVARCADEGVVPAVAIEGISAGIARHHVVVVRAQDGFDCAIGRECDRADAGQDRLLACRREIQIDARWEEHENDGIAVGVVGFSDGVRL